MRDCSKQISKFHREEVALTGDERSGMHKRRNANRDRVKNGLAKAGKPKPIGMHSQGSYSMWTMIQDDDCDYDIDDGIYFDAHVLKGPQGGEMTPLQVRQMICDAVQDQRFNRAPETKTNCVRVFYNEGYHVDLPTYRRVAKHSAWTSKVEYTYELASSSWKASDPRAVTDWFKETNEDVSPDYANTEGQFRRIVRLLKAFARSRASWKGKTATGFMITKLAADCFVASDGRDDIALRETMKAIKARLGYNQVVGHPKLPINITKEGDARPEHFRARLSENLPHLDCLDKSDCSHAEAMAAWDKVFARSWFCDQPEPKEGGTTTAPNKAVEKAGGGRYASGRRHA